MRARPTRHAAAAAAITLALGLGACSSGDGSADGTSEETADSTSTSDATSTDDESSSSTSSTSDGEDSSSTTSSTTSTDTGKPFDPEEFTGKLEKAVAKTPTAHILVTIEAGDQRSTAEGDQDIETGELEMDLDLAGQKASYRFVDGMYYLSQEPKWVAVDPESTNPVHQQLVQQIELASMKRQFEAFVGGVTAAGTKGEDDVNGVKTTHYTATVDTAKALAAIDEESPEGMPTTLIYDVWLDEDDLIRRMDFDLNGTRATMTADDWGLPVDIAKPKKSELAKQTT